MVSPPCSLFQTLASLAFTGTWDEGISISLNNKGLSLWHSHTLTSLITSPNCGPLGFGSLGGLDELWWCHSVGYSALSVFDRKIDQRLGPALGYLEPWRHPERFPSRVAWASLELPELTWNNKWWGFKVFLCFHISTKLWWILAFPHLPWFWHAVKSLSELDGELPQPLK